MAAAATTTTTGPLRCLPYSRPNNLSYSKPFFPSLHLHRAAAGAAYSLPSQGQRIKMFITKVSIWVQPLSGDGRTLPSMLCSASKEDPMATFSRKPEINQHFSDLYNTNMECPDDHEIRRLFSLPRILLMSSASMMILPFRALAETCEPNNSPFNMPILFVIALIGATVGGLLARQRRAELKKLNDQLRQINAALRRQAKIESYAPNLSYAPVNRVAELEIIVDPSKDELIKKLRAGKNYLRNQEPEKAFPEFQTAFELAESVEDHVEAKKAARGLGASLQRQGKYREAIKYHSKVLEISKKSGEDSGSTEAYGAIADCYTELGDLERAGKFYDKYIARLESD